MKLPLLSLTLVTVAAASPRAIPSREQPETVIVTYRAKQGTESELARTIGDHWQTARRLNLVEQSPHMLLKVNDDGGRVHFVEIFSWRDASIPDSAPPPIHALWDKLNSLVESRDGRAGLEFTEATIVSR
jgi:hypothetical protein